MVKVIKQGRYEEEFFIEPPAFFSSEESAREAIERDGWDIEEYNEAEPGTFRAVGPRTWRFDFNDSTDDYIEWTYE